jgi:hypothetical protein
MHQRLLPALFSCNTFTPVANGAAYEHVAMPRCRCTLPPAPGRSLSPSSQSACVSSPVTRAATNALHKVGPSLRSSEEWGG